MRTRGAARAAALVAGGFLLFSYLWILGTANVVGPLARVTGWDAAAIEVAKGLIYVTLAALLLYLVVRWYAARLDAAREIWEDLARATTHGLLLARAGQPARFVFANESFWQLTGLPRTPHPEPVEPLFGALADAGSAWLRRSFEAPSSGDRDIETQLIRPDGTRVWVQLSVTSARRGRHTYVQLMLADISDLRRRQEALRDALEAKDQAIEQQRRAMRLKDSILVSVSHGLRTPLTVVTGMAETLIRHGAAMDPEQHQRANEALTTQAARLRTMLDRLLEANRLEHGSLTAVLVEVDLAAVVREAVTSARTAPRVALHTPTRLDATADAMQIRRAVLELLDNTERYAPEAEVTVRLEADGPDGWQLTVVDDGAGVPRDEHVAVVEPFHRSHHDDPNPGVGIGLALVLEIARAHDGDVEVGHLDRGTSPDLGGSRSPERPEGGPDAATGFVIRLRAPRKPGLSCPNRVTNGATTSTAPDLGLDAAR